MYKIERAQQLVILFCRAIVFGLKFFQLAPQETFTIFTVATSQEEDSCAH